MTKEELNIWIKNHKQIDRVDYDYDNGNNWHTRIFQNKETEKLYTLDYLDDHPLHLYIEKKGYDFNKYPEPREVTKKSRMIEEIYYE